MESKKVKISKGSIVFYVFAVIFLLIMLYHAYLAYDQVSVFTKTNGTAPTFDQQYGLYSSTCFPYLAYAFVLYGVGLVLQKISDMHGALSICVESAVEEDDDDENVDVTFEELADLNEETEVKTEEEKA